jgi:hypothetical protein
MESVINEKKKLENNERIRRIMKELEEKRRE